MKILIKSKKVIIIFLSLITIAIILFLLANRYLIDHVEVVVSENKQKSQTGEIYLDDWSYKSNDAEINIKELQMGSSNDKITYFVADIILSDTSQLLSAFAENKFGRNIVDTTSNIAKENNAIFAINGDYYGFRDDGILIRNGKIYRDEGVRNGFAIYNNGILDSYDENSNKSDDLLSQGVINTLSFGPVLIDNGDVISDFNKVKVDSNFGNRSIQNSNPRTGIGMIEKNHFVFIVVDGRSKNYSKGMTLEEFAETFSELGCVEAYNLDGGGSSTMYFDGRIVNNPLGKNKERSISDILYISK